MKTDTYRVFEMNITKEEKATIESFCYFITDAMDYVDSFELIYYIIRAIAIDDKDVLDGTDFKIKINVEEEN